MQRFLSSALAGLLFAAVLGLVGCGSSSKPTDPQPPSGAPVLERAGNQAPKPGGDPKKAPPALKPKVESN